VRQEQERKCDEKAKEASVISISGYRQTGKRKRKAESQGGAGEETHAPTHPADRTDCITDDKDVITYRSVIPQPPSLQKSLHRRGE
jgi:hypothetical protein